ncbi:MAG: hypothetical protein P8X74_04975 [Reinekea sp.]|jgi:flagellar biosynthesis/type III secretory pathway M-ring protein FliF/YscJ
MNEFVSLLLPMTSIQSDRIQGMARYMNRDGASTELVTLGLIFIGMVALIISLKMVANYKARKHEAALRARLERKRSREKSTPS